MVTLSDMRSSNALVSSTLPPGLVAVFVGATSGIGETTLRHFAKDARQPRAYFVGRSQDAGDRIVAECKALNSAGEFIFVKADVSLISVMDEVCQEIKAKEKTINLLFLSAGVRSVDRAGLSCRSASTIRFQRCGSMEPILTTRHRNARAPSTTGCLGLLLSPPLHH